VTDPLRKRRSVDEADRLMRPDGETAQDASSSDQFGAMRALQQQAGNAAVASLLGAGGSGTAHAGAAPKAGSPGSSAPTATSGSGFEAALFDQSIMDPLRSIYALLRDIPPDPERALERLLPVGQALAQYEDRFRGRDDALANGFFAARGWLAGAVAELRGRLGTARPMSDEQIAKRVEDAISDLQGMRGRLG